MKPTTPTVALEPLSQSELRLRDPAEDIRERTVYDENGQDIGKVKDLIVDRGESRVRFLQLGAGGFMGIGEDTFLIPVDAITAIYDEGVHIDQSRDQVAASPKYQPDLAVSPDYFSTVYGYYGYPPYWAPEYTYPPYPKYPR